MKYFNRFIDKYFFVFIIANIALMLIFTMIAPNLMDWRDIIFFASFIWLQGHINVLLTIYKIHRMKRKNES